MANPISIEEINARIKPDVKLTAIGFPEIQIPGKRKVICRCECGTEKAIIIKDVTKGKIKSCGCVKDSHTHTIETINERIKTSRLTALSFTDYKYDTKGEKIRMCLCLCECGKTTSARVTSLMFGETRSCGCLSVDTATKYTHKNNWHIYSSWGAMIDRCYNTKTKRYKHYGGKGVAVCQQWKDNYQNFYDWSIANGWEEGLQIDKDILGNGMLYSPETCKWVTRAENMMYTTRARMVLHNGEMINLRVWCHNNGYDSKQAKFIYNRIRHGWTLEDAINTPKMQTQCRTKTP